MGESAEADAAQLAGLAAGAVEVFGLQKVFGPSWTRCVVVLRSCVCACGLSELHTSDPHTVAHRRSFDDMSHWVRGP
jgi:hypothetical protein